MSKKMQNLQNVLNSSAAPKVKAEASRVVSEPSNDSAKPVKAAKQGREGKENISSWLAADFKKSLRLVQLRKDGKVFLDDLVAEALNDLFIKYDVPTVRHE